MEQLDSQHQKVNELEAYLGGEMPDIGGGRTWKEERELLFSEAQVG